MTARACYTRRMGRVAGVLLVALILSPVGAVVCQARCLEGPAAASAAPASHCHEPATSGDVLTSAVADACAHPSSAETTVRWTAAVPFGLPEARWTAVALGNAREGRPTRPSATRLRIAPGDSSGTLRI